MSKEKALHIIKLLSAMESWAYAQKTPFPSYLVDHIRWSVGVLEEIVLKESK